MLSASKLAEIRMHLERAQNPLFFFDNDVDGLCAFLILRRAIRRGRGIPIKSYPELKEQYVQKIEELNPDTIFILDKAEVSKEFINAALEKNLPIIWIDHHETKTPKDLVEKTHYYNSLPSAEPTSYLAYKVFEKKEDMWLAMIGCIGEVYMPEFAQEFEKAYPELFNAKLTAFDALHSTEIGNLVRMLNFGQMDTTTNVIANIKYLFKVKGIYDLLEENQNTRQLHKRYNEHNTYYKKQIEKAEKDFDTTKRYLLFSYTGQTSMSSEIANRLCYNHKDRLIIVAFKKPEKTNVSIRGKDALKITKKIIEKIPEATGGGHKEATGMRIPADSWEMFKEEIDEVMK